MMPADLREANRLAEHLSAIEAYEVLLPRGGVRRRAASFLSRTPHALTLEVLRQKDPDSGGAWIWIDSFRVFKTTGKTGDGKIFVQEVAEAVRIRNERGDSAL
jgi:hypothetical protein